MITGWHCQEDETVYGDSVCPIPRPLQNYTSTSVGVLFQARWGTFVAFGGKKVIPSGTGGVTVCVFELMRHIKKRWSKWAQWGTVISGGAHANTYAHTGSQTLPAFSRSSSSLRWSPWERERHRDRWWSFSLHAAPISLHTCASIALNHYKLSSRV